MCIRDSLKFGRRCSAAQISGGAAAPPCHSHHHVADRIAPVTGADGTDGIGLDIIDHPRRQAVKDVVGRRRLGGLHNDGGSRGRGHAPVVDGRPGNGRRTRIQLTRAAAQRDGQTAGRGQNADW